MTRERETGNIYFRAIGFGLDRLEDGVGFQTFRQHISELGIPMSEYRVRMVFMEFYEVKEQENRGSPDRAIKDNALFVLRSDFVFRHLEHVELQEARSSSRNAMRMAMCSLVLATIVGALQISLAIECNSATQDWLSRMICTTE